MIARTPRVLLAFSALLLALGGAMHASAFKRTLAAIAASNLPAFFGKNLKFLWPGDSAMMFVLAAVFGLMAARPFVTTRSVVILLALLPAATAILVYVFLGSFFAGHILMTTAVAAFLAGLQFPGATVQSNASARAQ